MSFLGVIIDCNEGNWAQLANSGGEEDLQMMISSIHALCNMHLLSSINNHLLVMGARSDRAGEKLFSSAEPEAESAIEDVELKLRAAIVGDGESRAGLQDSRAVYVSSLATSICNHQKFRRDYGDEAVGKIVIVNLTRDLSAEQNILMNLFFVANQHSIKIDVASLNAAVPILQQACDITSGSHSLLHKPYELVQFLMTRGLGNSTEAEDAFEPGVEERVDYRAACNCHNKLVESGFVCSVCLAVHCEYDPLCRICGAFFRPPVRKRRKVN